MIKHLIKNSYNDIFNKLYDITEGNIILGGSAALKIESITDRIPNDLDVMLTNSNWLKYRFEIEKKFRIHPTIKRTIFDGLEYDSYTCFDKETKLNEFHLFVHYDENISKTINGIQIINTDIILKAKRMLCKVEQDFQKHLNDIKLIENFLNEK